MEVNEVKKKIYILRRSIRQMVIDFENETGCIFTGVSVDRHNEIDGCGIYNVNLEITVKP